MFHPKCSYAHKVPIGNGLLRATQLMIVGRWCFGSKICGSTHRLFSFASVIQAHMLLMAILLSLKDCFCLTDVTAVAWEAASVCLCCSKLQNRELRDHGGSRAGAVEDKPTVARQHFTHPVTLSVIHSKANRTNQSETTVQHLPRLWAFVIHSKPNLHTPSPADEDKD